MITLIKQLIKRLFVKKDLKELEKEIKHNDGLERSLDAVQLIMLGIGGVIGAGIFVLAGFGAAQYAGPAITISFVLSGLACICAGLCYAELAAMIPISGSSYTYSYVIMGEFVAWIILGMNILTFMLGAAAIANGWSSYVINFLIGYDIYLFPALSDSYGNYAILQDGTKVMTYFDLPAFIIVLTLSYVLSRGTKGSAILNNIITTIKMLILLSFITIGIFKVDIANWTPYIPENTGTLGQYGFSGIIAAASIVFMAFSGFDAIAAAAQETKNPKRDVPIGILGALILSTLTYILVSAVLTGIVHYSELDSASAVALAVDRIGISWYAVVFKLGTIIGLTAVIMVQLFSVTRILFAATHDGLIPKFLGSVHKKYHTPYRLTWVVGFTCAIVSGFFKLEGVVQVANLATLVTFTIVSLSTIILRYKRPDLPRDFKCPMVPLIPIISIVIFIGIMSNLSTEIFKTMAIWVTFLLIIYFTYSIKNSTLHSKNQ